MINSNYLKASYAALTTTGTSRPPTNIIDINGNQYATARITSTSGILYVTNTLFAGLTTGFNGGLFVGTNGTEATKNDINLYNRIDDSELNQVSMTKAINASGQMIFTRTFTYVGTTAKDIKEIGLFTSWTISTSTDYTPFMLAREVLNSPITVNNGDTFTISMAIG